MRFSIRDLLWATLVVAMGLGWWLSYRALEAKKPADDASKIIGRWRTPPEGWIKSEWGPSQFVIELNSSGEIKTTGIIREDSPANGVHSEKGTYSFADGMLTTELIAKGEPVKVEFNKDRMILTLPPEAPDKPIEVYEYVRDEKAAESSSDDKKSPRK